MASVLELQFLGRFCFSKKNNKNSGFLPRKINIHTEMTTDYKKCLSLIATIHEYYSVHLQPFIDLFADTRSDVALKIDASAALALFESRNGESRICILSLKQIMDSLTLDLGPSLKHISDRLILRAREKDPDKQMYNEEMCEKIEVMFRKAQEALALISFECDAEDEDGITDTKGRDENDEEKLPVQLATRKAPRHPFNISHLVDTIFAGHLRREAAKEAEQERVQSSQKNIELSERNARLLIYYEENIEGWSAIMTQFKEGRQQIRKLLAEMYERRWQSEHNRRRTELVTLQRFVHLVLCGDTGAPENVDYLCLAHGQEENRDMQLMRVSNFVEHCVAMAAYATYQLQHRADSMSTGQCDSVNSENKGSNKSQKNQTAKKVIEPLLELLQRVMNYPEDTLVRRLRCNNDRFILNFGHPSACNFFSESSNHSCTISSDKHRADIDYFDRPPPTHYPHGTGDDVKEFTQLVNLCDTKSVEAAFYCALSGHHPEEEVPNWMISIFQMLMVVPQGRLEHSNMLRLHPAALRFFAISGILSLIGYTPNYSRQQKKFHQKYIDDTTKNESCGGLFFRQINETREEQDCFYLQHNVGHRFYLAAHENVRSAWFPTLHAGGGWEEFGERFVTLTGEPDPMEAADRWVAWHERLGFIIRVLERAHDSTIVINTLASL